MTRTLLVGSVVAFALAGFPLHALAAEDVKVVRGTATMVTADAVTLTVANHDMKFSVDSTTRVEAKGAGTKMRTAHVAGRSGIALAEAVKPGQEVEVSYREAGAAMHAVQIHVISTVRTTDPNPAERVSGNVSAISATSLTITGAYGPGTFTQKFSIDAQTTVIGKGVGTAAAVKGGGRLPITALVASGDPVTVTFRKSGSDSLLASEVRVTK